MEDAVWQHRHVRSGSFHGVGFNNPRLLLCYRGGGAQSRRQRQFGYQTTADRKALRQKTKCPDRSPDSDEQHWRAIRVFQTPSRGHAGLDWRSGHLGHHHKWLTSKKSRRRHEPAATVWIPSSEEDEGDKWGSFRECCSTSHKLKSSFTSVSPLTRS